MYWVAVCALLLGGVALRAPALHANLYADDWDQYAIEKGVFPVRIASWDMFRWVGNGAAERQALLRTGRLPWWTSPELKLSVLRPLASLLAHFDYAALGGADHPNRLHIHTCLWWCFLVLGVASLMKQVAPLPVALLTTLIYALDDCFIMPFAWIANRSEIIALGFMAWALSFEVRAQQTGIGRWRVALFVFLGFCAGEHALAALAFIVAASFAAKGALLRRVKPLLPLGAIVAVYVLVRAVMGYGVAGSGFYIDPIGEPLRYLAACMTRIPILLSELVFSIPCEMSQGAPLPGNAPLEYLLELVATGSRDAPNFVGVGVVAGLLSIACCAWLARTHRAIAWLVGGAFMALIPLGGTMATGRLTAAPALGFDALLAFLLWRAGVAIVQPTRRWSRGVALVAAALIFSVALLVPVTRSHDGANYMNGMTNLERSWVEQADFAVQSLAGRNVFVLSARDLASEISIPYILHAAGKAMPESAALISPRGDSQQTLVRIADKSFELALGRPPAPNKFNGSVYRATDEVLHHGDKFHSTHFEVTVTETAAGQPVRLRFDFTAPLDNERFVFMVAAKERMMRFVMPRVGELAFIPAAQGP